MPAMPTPPITSPPAAASNAMPGGRLFTQPGYFSVTAPLGWNWTEDPDKDFGSSTGRTFIAQQGNRKGYLRVRQVDIPRADNEFRIGVLTGLSTQVEEAAAQCNATNLAVSGLSHRGKIPDSLDFSYSMQTGRTRTVGGGRIIFGRKRVSIVTYVSDVSNTAQSLKAAAGTYQEL